jgi:hypothetical protein
MKEIKQLVRNECAGYFADSNYCCQYNCTCVFYDKEISYEESLENPIRCKYFEHSVLPIDSQIQRDYLLDRGMHTKNVEIKISRCKICGAITSQKYCDSCMKEIKQKQLKKKMAKK